MHSLRDKMGGYHLFSHLQDLCYFAKDREGRFIGANPFFLEMVGMKDESPLLGKTDFDIWPRFLAEHYVKDDNQVIETGRPVVNKVELVFRHDHSVDWFATTKVALIGDDGECVGIEGVSRYLKKAKQPFEQVLKFPTVITYIMENYSRKIEIPALAAMVSLSVKQFERKFKQEYGAVPVQYIQRIRLDAARQMLAVTRLTVAQISRETGFYDSSHFSHQFQKYTGLSPKAFRQKHLTKQE